MQPLILLFCLCRVFAAVDVFGSPFKPLRRCNASIVCGEADLLDSPLCGSDGRTYDSECDLKRVVCAGKAVKIHHEGPCSSAEKCPLDRSFQKALLAEDADVFVPKCNDSDGSYNKIQCHGSTGYCWCVSKEGRPIPKTHWSLREASTLQEAPKCEPRVGRRSNRRRTHVERNNPKACTFPDRTIFNDNLLKMFAREYGRLPEEAKRDAKTANLTTERAAAYWKFEELDSDADGAVSKTEIEGLGRIVRGYVKPPACARQFPEVCDSDRDGRIGREEWIGCLGDNFAKVEIQHIKGPLRNPGKPAAIAATARPPKPPPPASSSDFLARRPSGVLGGLTAPNRPSEEVTSDCITMRRVMISRHGNASQLSGYVPVCTGPDDKLYDAVQCHKATGYCWCVNQATNYPIPNTSTLGKPNCTALRLRPRTSFRRQTIKGCKPRKQAAFFQRFFRSIETEMIAAIGPQRSKQRIDRIAKWKFRQLDANKNKVLEKEEWKPYRGELRQFNKMRRCGRNFFRFCDQDRNKKITFDEWRRCTVDATRKKPRKKVEKTQNPFLYILRPEE